MHCNFLCPAFLKDSHRENISGSGSTSRDRRPEGAALHVFNDASGCLLMLSSADDVNWAPINGVCFVNGVISSFHEERAIPAFKIGKRKRKKHRVRQRGKWMERPERQEFPELFA